MKDIGNLLKKYRISNGLTTRQVSLYTGVTNVSRYETGISEPTFKTVVALFDLYGMHIYAQPRAVNNETEKDMSATKKVKPALKKQYVAKKTTKKK